MTTTPKIIGLQSAGPGILAVLLETVSNEQPGAGSSVLPDALDLTLAKWQVNGAQPSVIHHSSLPSYETPALPDGTVDITSRHVVCLTLGKPFQDGNYAIATPYGTAALMFGAKITLAPCIKVNQASYAKASTVRFANLGVWRGDGSAMAVSPLPTYQVIRESDGTVVQSGAAAAAVDDTGLTGPKSGERVHRLDLSAVAEGGPYFVTIPGIGRSYSFYVGGTAERTTACVALRCLTIARCGQELKAPWSTWNRPACHLQVADARVPWADAHLDVPSGAKTFPIRGGYHDAGDFDRRPHHIIIPISLLTYHEAWPSHTDDRMGLPEDGDGIPALLNEALWGVLGLQNLQIDDASDPLNGGVRVGTEQAAHPGYGTDNAATDKGVYGTWGVDGPAGTPAEGFTAFAAGVFAQASRLVRQYDTVRADDLERRARLAWGYHASHNTPTAIEAYNLYGSLQLYLTTGESVFHVLFKAQANAILVQGGTWPVQYLPGNLSAQVQSVHFASYTLSTSRAVDATVVDAIKAKVIWWADQGGYMGTHPLTDPYPVTATKFYGWGSCLRACDVFAWASRFTADPAKQQSYYNAMSLQADGILGLNAMGMSYVVGLGVEQPNCPGHLDSYFAEKDTGHPITGVMVYGPADGRSGYDYQKVVTNKLFPAWESRSIYKHYAHGWGALNQNEDSVHETRVWFTILWAFLHDASKDPAPQPGTDITMTAVQYDSFKHAVSELDSIRDQLALKFG